MVNESVQTGSGMNIDLCDGAVKVVLQTAARFVLSIEV
jgi:hypothetical protein